MQFTTRRLEVSRNIVRQQTERVARQQSKLAQAKADRSPADELQARLLIMEQSLIAMTRYLRILERDLTDEMSLQQSETQQRLKGRRKSDGPAPSVARLADDFASQAAAAVLAADDGVNGLETLAKALLPLGRR